MPAPYARTPRLLAGAFAALLIVSACSSGAVATSSPTASPTPTATPTRPPTPRPTLRPTPSPTPTPTPSPSAKPDAAASLKIGAPYTLAANAANKAFSASFAFDMAGEHVEATMNGREIRRSGTMVGIALVMHFDGIPMSRAIFDAAAQGGANSSVGKLSFTTILGNRVGLITTKQATIGMYVLHDTIVMIGGVKAADWKTLLTSVIKANK